METPTVIDYRDVEVVRFSTLHGYEPYGGPPRAYYAMAAKREAYNALVRHLMGNDMVTHEERTGPDGRWDTVDEYTLQVVAHPRRRKEVAAQWDGRREDGVRAAMEVVRSEIALRESLGEVHAAFVLENALKSIERVALKGPECSPLRLNP